MAGSEWLSGLGYEQLMAARQAAIQKVHNSQWQQYYQWTTNSTAASAPEAVSEKPKERDEFDWLRNRVDEVCWPKRQKGRLVA